MEGRQEAGQCHLRRETWTRLARVGPQLPEPASSRTHRRLWLDGGGWRAAGMAVVGTHVDTAFLTWGCLVRAEEGSDSGGREHC